MKKLLWIAALVISFGASAEAAPQKNNDNITTQISNSLSANEKKVREAQVV